VHSALCLGLAAGATLVSVHNVAYMQRLALRMRVAIRDRKFEGFVQQFMLQQYPGRDYPEWIVDALRSVTISLL
jgi:queuine/archaeosine tRNA-ribosyltransferase